MHILLCSLYINTNFIQFYLNVKLTFNKVKTQQDYYQEKNLQEESKKKRCKRQKKIDVDYLWLYGQAEYIYCIYNRICRQNIFLKGH